MFHQHTRYSKICYLAFSRIPLDGFPPLSQVGQHVAALEYLIPKEYTKTLSVLMNKAPESTFEDVRGVVEEDLGMKVKRRIE